MNLGHVSSPLGESCKTQVNLGLGEKNLPLISLERCSGLT